MTTRRGLFGLFAGALVAPKIAKAMPLPAPAPPSDVYTFTPRITNFGDYTIKITGLPKWASFDAQTGEITGTPPPKRAPRIRLKV